MPLTFGQLRDETLGWLDESAAAITDQSYLNVTAALKQAHTLRLTEDNWKFMLWPKEVTISATTATSYSLHQEFLRPYYIRNSTRSAWLIETPGRNFDSSGLDPTNDSDTLRFQLAGRAAVAAQPSSASVVTIVSTSAADNTAAKAIIITGDTASGMNTDTITPAGLTPVAGTVAFTTILSITKSAAWAGTLTCTSNSAAVTNLTLLSSEYGRSYQQLQLLYTPSGSETLVYKFYRRPRELSNTYDMTDIPPPFERVLVFDALLMLGAYDARLDQGRMSVWGQMRSDLDFQMRQTQIEGQSIGAEARFIGGTGNQYRSARFPD